MSFLSLMNKHKAFKRYAKSYKIEITDSKDPLAQVEARKSIIKDLFKGLLHEMKAFKYQNNSKRFAKNTKEMEK